MESRIQLMQLYAQLKKDTGIAYVLLLVLGLSGAHYFYLKKIPEGIIVAVLSLTVIGLVISIPIVLVNLLTLASSVNNYNTQLLDSLGEQFNIGDLTIDGISRPPLPTDAQQVLWEQRERQEQQGLNIGLVIIGLIVVAFTLAAWVYTIIY